MVRLLTWNLKGTSKPDLEAVAAVVAGAGPDVVLLQEVQRGQCRRLAAAGGFPGRRWTFKHWPIVAPAEGLAVLSRTPLSTATAFVLQPAWPWSWRRRVGLEATVILDARPVRFINVHLSPHDAEERRSEEVDRVVLRRGVAPPIVAGDFNDRPGGPALRQLMGAGWADAWALDHAGVGREAVEASEGDADVGATNWTGGDRAGRPPTQRLDFVFVPSRWAVRSCDVIDEPIDRLAALSDHLPVVADLEVSGD